MPDVVDSHLIQRPLVTLQSKHTGQQQKQQHGPQSVSYTHLDVYKRQGVLSMFSDGKTSIKEKMAKLNRNTRMVFDYLRMTKNSTRLTAV